MLVTLSGIVMLTRLVQSRNAELSILSPLVITTVSSLLWGMLEIAIIGSVAFSIGQVLNA